MAPARKKPISIALAPEEDGLLSRAAREGGVSRSEFIRQHLALVLEHIVQLHLDVVGLCRLAQVLPSCRFWKTNAPMRRYSSGSWIAFLSPK